MEGQAKVANADPGNTSPHWIQVSIKASTREREDGLAAMPRYEKSEHCLRYHDGRRRADGKEIRNTHPTVKPVDLMSYLITLGSRPGNVVLDPFVGSGTTCIAADLLNRRWIGIERDSAYAGIARSRLQMAPNVRSTKKRNGSHRSRILNPT